MPGTRSPRCARDDARFRSHCESAAPAGAAIPCRMDCGGNETAAPAKRTGNGDGRIGQDKGGRNLWSGPDEATGTDESGGRPEAAG